jgi:tetratricopeptide (TPR) repeat protein
MTTRFITLTLLAAFAAAAGPPGAAADPDPAAPAAVDPDPEPPSDPMSDLRLEEALLAMDSGEFERALDLAMLAVMQNKNDPRAHREAGRAAHALGRFQIAIDHLERAVQLEARAGHADPEARYLLGEAYYVSGRPKDAVRHHDQVRRDISPDTSNWMELLWLARIHARRRELAAADRIYLGLLEREPTSVEVKIARIEAYTLSGRWKQAEKLLREFMAGHPDYQRAPEMLAWILEAQHKTGEESALRAKLALDPTRAETRLLVDHARALERSGQYRAAMARYQEALTRSEAIGGTVDELEVEAAVTRLRYRLTTETAVAGGTFIDPSGSFYRVRGGVAIPAGDVVSIALLASMDRAARGAVPGAMATPGVSVGSVDASIVAGEGHLMAGALTVSGSYFNFDDGRTSGRVGTAFDLRVGAGKPLQLHTVGTLGMPWRETASTVREGGRETGVTSMAYALPFGPRLIFDAGVRVRALSLDPMFDVEATGTQKMLIGGADWVVWAPSTRSVRGQFLDDDLRWGTSYLADSLTLSYRHYEAFIDDDFGGRLDLSERGTVDDVSAIARNTWPDGNFAFEVRAGGGYDWARATRLWRTGASLLVTPLDRLRGSLSYDYANESASGFVGSRHTGWANLHLDF